MAHARSMALGAALFGAACGGDAIDEPPASGSGGAGTAQSSISSATGATGATGGGGGAGDGGAGASGGSGGAAQATRVFVSSGQYTGAFGGLAGADAKCQGLADTAGLGGTWLAWLGDGTVAAADRLVHSPLPYLLVDGTEIAKSWDDLIDTTPLEVPIDHDETSATLKPGALFVRTGAFSGGTAAPLNCIGMTSADSNDYALTGVATAVDQNWTMSVGNPCSELDRLYCFEQ